MGRRKATDPDSTSSGRLTWLRRELAEVKRDVVGARPTGEEGDRGNWAAVAALHRQSQSLRGEIDREVQRLADLPNKQAIDPTTMTPAEWLARVTEDARACSDADLEVYLREYATRHKLRALVVDGLPTFQRKTG